MNTPTLQYVYVTMQPRYSFNPFVPVSYHMQEFILKKLQYIYNDYTTW